jgi:putative transposase
VVRTLNRLKLGRGVPKVLLFCDNGSEFTSQAMDLWAYRHSTGRFERSTPSAVGEESKVSNAN